MPEREFSEGGEAKIAIEQIELDPASAERIRDLALQLPAGVYGNFQERGNFLKACEAVTAELTDSNVDRALEELRTGKRVALTITDLPRDPALPPAPLEGRSPTDKSSWVSEGVAAAIALRLGYPSMIYKEKEEALVHQITPVAGQEASQSNEGSVALNLHQDLAPNPELKWLSYDVFMPDWLILTGVQTGSGETPTYLATLDEALDRISTTARNILMEQRFVTDPPYSFQKEGASTADLPVHTVITERNGQYESAFDISSNVRPKDPSDHDAAVALQALHEALAAVKQEVVIRPGTSVIFNNRRVIHGRGPVKHESENLGTKRWIQRVYVFDTDRFVDEAIRRDLKIQHGGGLLQVTSPALMGLQDEFTRLMPPSGPNPSGPIEHPE